MFWSGKDINPLSFQRFDFRTKFGWTFLEKATRDHDVTTARVGLTLCSFRCMAEAGVGVFLGPSSLEI